MIRLVPSCSWVVAGVAWLLILVVAGCGGSDGPVRYQISGTVTYGGQPVPKGFITITPDTSQGNDGPGGGAPIENGSYRTETSKGIVGGPHHVKIVGYDGIATSMEGEQLPDGQSLFTPYQTTVDFPKQDSKHNFDIPKSAQ
jgi:hypothetical protein